jgi:putative flippase GtrA
VKLRGWHPDPSRQHVLRYFSMNGQPSRLVSDGGKSFLDPPWNAPPLVQPVAAPLPRLGTKASEQLQAQRTWKTTDDVTSSMTGGTRPAPTMTTLAPRLLDSLLCRLPDGRRATTAKAIRFGSVAVISTLAGIAMLGIFIGVLGYPAIWSNVLAKTVGMILSFELSRRWVWARNGEGSILRPAIPFALFSVAGLLLSTFAVHLAADATSHSSRLIHTATAELASIASYIPLLLIQFVLCDRVLFRMPTTAATARPGNLDSLMDSLEGEERFSAADYALQSVAVGDRKPPREPVVARTD